MLSFQSCKNGNVKVVKTVAEFNLAIENAIPGDKIVLANGTWENVELLINAKGTSEKPIIVTVEEKGKVLLSGLSTLRISGEFIEVSGLVFKNGYTPSTEAISFREKTGVYANNCRLTECVIDNYNSPERFANEIWVALYGKNNRVDHCIFTGKRTSGVTLIVAPVDEACQNNNHQIDHNYFGYRQSLGSNGGETLRLGTSQYSLTTSGTTVEANYFDRCNGEQEIISNKSCGNSFKNNTFFECKGTLTFRHGHDNVAEGNFFFGNGKDDTGGIRIINERNRAINNYFYGVTGYRFRGALVVMNGVPNSPINRYNQVIEGIFSNNTFVNCDYIQLCAGSDAERSLPPINSKIENNVFYYKTPKTLFTAYDDISGIAFINNYTSKGIEPLAGATMESVDMELVQNSLGIWYPKSVAIKNAGCSLEAPVATKDNTGLTWYRIKEEELLFDNGNKVFIEPGLNTLVDAIATSNAGDIIVLNDGEYVNSKNIQIKHPLTIKASTTGKAVILSEKPDMFTIENEGSLKLIGLVISGKNSPDNAGNSVISTSKYSMNRNYKIIAVDCKIENLDVNHSFDFLRVFKNTFADTIMFKNCSFKSITGSIANLNKETDDLGIYNAEYVIYENTTFENVGGAVLDLYRGGTDESTFGPILQFSRCTVNKSGMDKRNKTGGSIYLHGVQLANISESSFIESAPFKIHLTNGEPVTNISNLNIFPKAQIQSNSNEFKLKNLTHNKN
jgi:poly(beta-D-mannuronate) lyase